jgi:deoxyribose-phosphate aldolase
MSLSQTDTEGHCALEVENQCLAQSIDHTKLTFAAGEDEAAVIEALCQEAMAFGFYAVCVRPRHISQAKALLGASTVKVATVIGFPKQKVQLTDERKQPTVGDIDLSVKVEETRQAVAAGADELDLVVNVPMLKRDVQTGTHQVRDELQAIANVSQGRPVKVIIETDLLEEKDIVQVTTWCAETGMAMVKTSTGMVEGGQGATLAGVQLIAETLRQCGAHAVEIKALAFLSAGASRLGTSSGVAIVQGAASVEGSSY